MSESAQRPQHPSTTLLELRLEAGLSAAQLAKAAGVAPNTVLNAERGGVPRPHLQQRIAAALSTNLDRHVGQFDLWPLANGQAA